MAITIITQPLIAAPNVAYGEKDKVIYKFSSSASPLVSCIVEVIVGNVRIAALNVQKDKGTTNEFTIVLNEILQNYLDFKLYTTTLSTYDATDSGTKQYSIKIYEVTEPIDTLITTYDPDNDSNVNYQFFDGNIRNVFNCTLDAIKQNSFNATDYQLSANTKKFLNDTPSAKDIELNQSEYLGALWYDGTAGQSFKIEILTYNSADALLNTDYIDITDWNAGYSGGAFSSYYITIPVGTANLIAASVSLTNVSYYTVKIINSTGDVSELKRFNIVGSCDSDVRIHWQNKYGKRDSYTFKGNKQESIKHKASTFIKSKGISYSSDDRGISVLQNISNTNFTVYSRSIGRTEYHWLSDMLINKRAFVEIGGNYFPIIIEDGTFFKTDENDMPIQFVLEYSFANPTKGIRG